MVPTNVSWVFLNVSGTYCHREGLDLQQKNTYSWCDDDAMTLDSASPHFDESII